MGLKTQWGSLKSVGWQAEIKDRCDQKIARDAEKVNEKLLGKRNS